MAELEALAVAWVDGRRGLRSELRAVKARENVAVRLVAIERAKVEELRRRPHEDRDKDTENADSEAGKKILLLEDAVRSSRVAREEEREALQRQLRESETGRKKFEEEMRRQLQRLESEVSFVLFL